ncbi:hypothetical protein MRB53_012712 [Persea americana]|uniref:Uncharacterized protein n=1 Tax=Persea americana TaxID=3435 RepID=A0ACC2LYI1_PERAE|nr:hypothetical protein MRB53_012712 [Persea americana]
MGVIIRDENGLSIAALSSSGRHVGDADEVEAYILVRALRFALEGRWSIHDNLLSPRIDEHPISLHVIGPESDEKDRIPNGFESNSNRSIVCILMISKNKGGDVETKIGVLEADFGYLHASPISVVELRRKTMNGAPSEESVLWIAEPVNHEKGMEMSS